MIKYPQDPVIEEVLNRFKDRADAGMKKYGYSMIDAPETTVQWIDHAIEEAMDFVNYLTRLRRDMEKQTNDRT